MNNIMHRSGLDQVADKIDTSRWADKIDAFLCELEKPTKKGLNSLVDQGFEAVRSNLGLKRRSYAKHGALAALALGVAGYFVYQNFRGEINAKSV